MSSTLPDTKPVKPTYQNYFELGLSRHDAKALMKVLNADESPFMSDSTKRRLRSDIKKGLAPWYTYEIQCQDCPRTYTIRSRKKISPEDIAKGGICSICSDDYK